MWVNEMLTIWLWGTILSIVVVGLSLYKWYWVDARNSRRD